MPFKTGSIPYLQNAAFHQGLHCKGKKDLQTKEYNIIWKL